MSHIEITGFKERLPQTVTIWAFSIFVTSACILPAILLGLIYGIKAHSRSDKLEGCRRLGLQGQSNLVDEHEERYSHQHQGGDSAGWKVKSLWIYPVKSCTGVELSRHTITGKGMEYDRHFCFAQLTSKLPADVPGSDNEKANHTWKFITQRTFAAMANIKTEVWIPDPSSPKYSKNHPNVQSGGVLVLKFPNLAKKGLSGVIWNALGTRSERTVHIPFNPTEEQVSSKGYTTENMQIWKDSPASLLMTSTEDPASWIHDLRFYLGISNHLGLFRICPEKPREVYRCAPHRDELGYQSTVGFQDAYPLHILNLASVHDVAEHMDRGTPPLGARNFRPNIIITGGDAYAEDAWKRIRIGDYVYHVACRTVRCLLPNVNPATGIRHRSEPNRTLKEFRRIDGGDPLNACLGMQMVPALEQSQIRTGDAITVQETGEHFYIKQ